ncbi:hypothetical protein [Brevibacterium atlanticum]|uniref:hypothetical protein n=1 Tax=Brevibacterium atlanticum TaxID=2697563 RepID=UPI001423CFB1|nr:hypothetical protein [Brevibacterium atlanticum]
MKLRAHKLSTTIFYGIVLAGFVTVVFFLTNAGIDPRAHRYGDFDPANAGAVSIGLLGLYHAIAIIFFDDDPEPASAEDGRTTDDPTVPRKAGSFTAFVRQPALKVFSVGPIWAALSAAVIFIWFAAADVPGTIGTVWGDYGVTPLPALVVLFGCWAAANLGFTFSTLAEAGHRDNPPLYISSLILLFLVAAGVVIYFLAALPDMRSGTALAVNGLMLLISLAGLTGARLWAMPRFARETKQRQQQQGSRGRRPQKRFGSRPADSRQPPYDILEAGETLFAHFIGEGTPEPQMLVATNRRVVRALIRAPGHSFVIEQAQPGQLLGAEMTRQGTTIATIVHLRDRPTMLVTGGDPAAATRFAAALTSLAHTGRLPNTR